MSIFMKSRLLGFILTAFAVVVPLLAFHCFIGRSDSSLAHSLKEVYFYDGDRGRVYLPLFISVYCPAIILGVSFGACGANWPVERLVVGTIVLSFSLIALMPAYGYCFSDDGNEYWILLKHKERLSEKALTGMSIASLALFGFSVNAARSRMQEL